jgi:mannitol/fructose-specific phosphotransferase system IIA component (Ntr-type)
MNLAAASLIGIVSGWGYLLSTRRLTSSPELATASLVAVLFCWGLTHLFGASSILACVFLGITLSNGSRTPREETFSSFTSFQPAIYAVFFTLAGVHLEFHHLAAAGALAVIVFAARSLAKVGGVTLGLTLAGAPKRMRSLMGIAMLPHASIAVGLMLLIQSDPQFADVSDTILAVGLSVVTVSEVLGPLGTRWALLRSGEMGKAAPRLLDFLQEADITVGLEAQTKEEVIRKLVDQLVHTHRLETSADSLFQSVVAREEEVSTCLGGGLMIPHAELDEGTQIVGVMAISLRDLPFETPDGIPVRCVVLLATPPSQRAHHLEVLAALARAIGTDPNVRDNLFNSRTAAHAWEVLHQQDSAHFNYFLERQPKK